jgi:hypothetical protein
VKVDGVKGELLCSEIRLRPVGSDYPLHGVGAISPYHNITQYLEAEMIVLRFSAEIVGKAPGQPLHL